MNSLLREFPGKRWELSWKDDGTLVKWVKPTKQIPMGNVRMELWERPSTLVLQNYSIILIQVAMGQ